MSSFDEGKDIVQNLRNEVAKLRVHEHEFDSDWEEEVELQRKSRPKYAKGRSSSNRNGRSRRGKSADEHRKKEIERERDELRKLTWGLKYQLERTRTQKAKIEESLREKEAKLRKVKAHQRSKSADSRSRRRKPRHVEVLAKAREIDEDYFGKKSPRSHRHRSVSRREKMASRARVRSEEQQLRAKEYERRRKEEALLEAEKRAKAEAQRKQKRAELRERERVERMRALQQDYQQEWHVALEQTHESALRSRPSMRGLNVEPLVQGSGDFSEMQTRGVFEVEILEEFLQIPNREVRIRMSLLPHGDSKILEYPFQGAVRHLFTFDPSLSLHRADPMLRFEVHKQERLVAVSEEPLQDCMCSISAVGASVTKQVALGYGVGILKLRIGFSFLQANRPAVKLFTPTNSRLQLPDSGAFRIRICEVKRLVNAKKNAKIGAHFIVSPWMYEGRTIAKKGTSENLISWLAEEATFDVQYPGPPPPGHVPFLHLKIEENGTGMSFGQTSIDLVKSLCNPNQIEEIETHLFTQTGLFAGVAIVHVGFATGFGDGKSLPSPEPVVKMSSGWAWGNTPKLSPPADISVLVPEKIKYEISRKISVTEIPSKELAKMFQQPGTLFVRAHHAKNLHTDQHFMRQDPYVKLKLQNGTEASTAPVFRGGLAPKWSVEGGTVQLSFIGVPNTRSWPTLEIALVDKEYLRSDQAIGVATLRLADLSEVHYGHEVEIFNKETKAHAGTLLVETWFKPDLLSPVTKLPTTKQAAHPGSIVLQIISCNDLRNVQKGGRQDPFVVARLLPWNICGQTKKVTDGGMDPVWSKEKGMISLSYPGAPPHGENARIQIEVRDFETTPKSQMIGECLIDLREEVFQKEGLASPRTINLKTKSNHNSGVIQFQVGFQRDSSQSLRKASEMKVIRNNESHGPRPLTLQAIPIRAKGLKSVQWIGKQDPYVKITHVWTKAAVKNLCHANGGLNPEWDIVQHESDLRLPLGVIDLRGKNENEELILIEVFDAEAIMQDRLIGRATMNIRKDVLRHPSHDTDVPFSVRLRDKGESDAGILQIKFTIFEAVGGPKGIPKAIQPWYDAKGLVKMGVLIQSVWVRVERGENIISENEQETIYCALRFNARTFYTTKTKKANIPRWEENEGILLDAKRADAAELRNRTINFSLYAKRKMLDKCIGSGEISLERVPYVFLEERNDFTSHSCFWIPIEGNPNPDAKILVSVLLIKPRAESEAALRIQSMRRTQLVRRQTLKKLNNRNEAAKHIQRLCRGQIARKCYCGLLEARHNFHALDCYTETAIRRARQRLRQDHSAAVVIQKRFRGASIRKRIKYNPSSLPAAKRTPPRGTLRLTPVRAWGLRNRNLLMRQDPYVRMTLEPGHVVQQTKACSNGGVEPSWDVMKHKACLEFKLPDTDTQSGQSFANLAINIRISDKDMVGKDRLIGEIARWTEFREILRQSKLVRNRKFKLKLDSTGKTNHGEDFLEVLVDWIPESHFIYVVTKIQGLFRVKLQRAQYRLEIQRKKKAIAIQRKVREYQSHRPFKEEGIFTPRKEVVISSLSPRARFIKPSADMRWAQARAAVRIQAQFRAVRSRRMSIQTLQRKLEERERRVLDAETKAEDKISMTDHVNVAVHSIGGMKTDSFSILSRKVAVRLTVSPGGMTARTTTTWNGRGLETIWPKEEVIELGLPVRRDVKQWPVLAIEVVRPSLLIGTPDIVLARGDYTLTAHLQSMGSATDIVVPLKYPKREEEKNGEIHLSVAVHLLHVEHDIVRQLVGYVEKEEKQSLMPLPEEKQSPLSPFINFHDSDSGEDSDGDSDEDDETTKSFQYVN